MKVYLHNLNDVQKYFHGTFIVCPEFDPKKLLYVSRVNHDGIEVSFSDDNINTKLGLIKIDEESSYEIKSPLTNKKQWFQHHDRACLISRIPARMWKKGIHEDNTRCALLSSTGSLQTVGQGPTILERMLNFVPPTEFPKREEPLVSLALDHDWAWVKKTNDLLYKEYTVGRLSQRSKKVILLRELVDIPFPSILRGYKRELV